MYICDVCLKQSFTNRPSLFKSRGPCEFCDQIRVCNSIASFALKPIPKKPKAKGAA